MNRKILQNTRMVDAIAEQYENIRAEYGNDRPTKTDWILAAYTYLLFMDYLKSKLLTELYRWANVPGADTVFSIAEKWVAPYYADFELCKSWSGSILNRFMPLEQEEQVYKRDENGKKMVDDEGIPIMEQKKTNICDDLKQMAVVLTVVSTVWALLAKENRDVWLPILNEFVDVKFGMKYFADLFAYVRTSFTGGYDGIIGLPEQQKLSQRAESLFKNIATRQKQTEQEREEEEDREEDREGYTRAPPVRTKHARQRRR